PGVWHTSFDSGTVNGTEPTVLIERIFLSSLDLGSVLHMRLARALDGLIASVAPKVTCFETTSQQPFREESSGPTKTSNEYFGRITHRPVKAPILDRGPAPSLA